MKELYLAMDRRSGNVYGYVEMPLLDLDDGVWSRVKGTIWYNPPMLLALGIDVTKLPLTHETPIKIRAVWEVVE